MLNIFQFGLLHFVCSHMPLKEQVLKTETVYLLLPGFLVVKSTLLKVWADMQAG